MRSTSQSHTAQDIKALRAEVTRLTNIVKDMPAHAKEDASNVIGFDSRELRKMAKKAGKDARKFLNEKQQQVTDLRDEAEDRISSRPFRSVGLAVVAGALIGALLNR